LDDWEAAEEHFREALHLNYNDMRTPMIARCLAGLGAVAVAHQAWQRATHLLSAAYTIFGTLPPFLAPADHAWYEQQVQTTRTELDETLFTAAWSQGATMPLEQAVAYALADAE
jgi:hypothetical protein